MCAIFGIGFLNGHRIVDMARVRLILDVLFKESQSRGRRASGITFTTPHEIAIVKKDLSADLLISTDEYRDACKKYMEGKRLVSIIGHCRYPTKGEPEDNNNNHPIVARRVIGVHNGMIGNDDDLFDEYKSFAGKGWHRAGLVDSEIIFRLLDYYFYTDMQEPVDAIKTTCKNLTGSYACAFVTTRDKYYIWLFRNHMPISLMFYPKLGVVIFASAKDFINKSLYGLNLGREVEIEVPTNSGIGIDLFNNSKTKFDLEKPVGVVKHSRQPAGFLVKSTPATLPGILPPPAGEE